MSDDYKQNKSNKFEFQNESLILSDNFEESRLDFKRPETIRKPVNLNDTLNEEDDNKKNETLEKVNHNDKNKASEKKEEISEQESNNNLNSQVKNSYEKPLDDAVVVR